MIPRYVIHDDERWRVTALTPVDNLDGYELKRGTRTLYAYCSDCIPDDRPRKRRLRDGEYVLEFDSRGSITIREAGRRKRFTTTLGAIYAMTVKATVLNKKKPRKPRRGLLRRG